MDYYGDAEISAMLSEFGNKIRIGAKIRPCIVDERDEEGLEQDGNIAAQIKRVTVATIRTNDFPSIANGQALSVDGTSYTVWRHMKREDGALTELFLRKA